ERRKAKLSAELEFEFTGVGGGFEGDVRVTPTSLAAAKSARHTPRPGQHLVIELPLVSGATLAGLVVDDLGAPVADAQLEVTIDPVMMGQGGFEVRKGRGDAEGRFTLAHVLPGEVLVVAEADGHLDARKELTLVAGETRGDLRFELSLGNAIAGHLRWPDGTPAVDIEVEAQFDAANLGGMGAFNAMRGPRGDATTDATGAFRITGLGKGPFTVRAESERDGATWNVRRDAVAPQTLDLELELEETLAIAGRVVDDTGAPLAKFRVRASEKTGGMIPGLGGAQVSDSFEDEAGVFRLEGLSDRTWLVRAQAEGHGQGDALEIALTGAPREGLVLTLPRAASVQGVVVTPEGRALAGAEVTLKFELADLATMGERGAAAAATSATDGTFLLEGLTPGALSLVASAAGFAESGPAPVDLQAAQVLEDVRLTLRMGGRILGEIYDSSGERQAGAPILAQNPTNFSGQKWATADSNGEFVFENLAPGTWQVMTMPGRGSIDSVEGSDESADFSRIFSEMKFQMAEVVEGQDAHVVLGGRPADPVHVRGRVRAGGVPQAGALVNFMADGGAEQGGGMGAFKFTTTAKDGSYALELDRSGGYMVQVQKLVGSSGQQQSVQLHFTLPDEREQTLDLELPVGSITGLVRGPDGQPLGGARVSLTLEGGVSNLTFGGGQYAEIATKPDGTYELVWLRAGKYSVSAGGPLMGGMFGGGEDAPARAVRAGVRVGDGDRVDGIDFRLKAPGRLVGTVSDASGKPVADAAVFVRDEHGNLLERISLAATDAAGRFTYSGIGAGRYQVHARTQGEVSAEVAVNVREGEDAELALSLSPGAVLLVTLADEEGQPVDCSVTVTDDDGRQVNGNWSMADLMSMFQSGAFSSKEQRVGPVPPGRYTIHAENVDGLSATKRVTVRDQDERKVNLRLKE
ncbi:MAG TPA: carboxypeptidase-like regulatory domain-containing protein, partial [Planctomycetota bacterium]|nr:carboxypeptidase-like regulatory domain-containing protein [Planctomycetota bacterium]